MKALVICLGLLVGISFPFKKTYAQKKTVSVLVGGGLAYVHSKGQTLARDSSVVNAFQKYDPIITPQLSLHLNVPVRRNVSFETGLTYQQKGFKSSYRFDNVENGYRSHFESVTTTRIHYLRIPVSVEYTFFRHRTSYFNIGIGMDYGFALKARAKGYFSNSYPATGEVSRYEMDIENEIKLLAGDNRLANYKDYWADLFLFDVAFASNIEYVHKGKYIFRIFHSASLYPHIAREEKNLTSRLRYSGIAIGYRF